MKRYKEPKNSEKGRIYVIDINFSSTTISWMRWASLGMPALIRFPLKMGTMILGQETAKNKGWVVTRLSVGSHDPKIWSLAR